ncbi:hypothetical protein SAMN05421788_1011459 [Filimonas lacunae]|uniref:Uncharacterized protein n=1 Tax=Filimonas lacunae TaxID=477680 RepID=A0A1N7M9P6_9BACT|nr:hypothetical protein SAMN05421788_1011459 [Filimonas lacunae]
MKGAAKLLFGFHMKAMLLDNLNRYFYLLSSLNSNTFHDCSQKENCKSLFTN